MIQIAVLMACHNRKEKTIACLASLFSQVGRNEIYKIRVFLVDDDSTDGTGDAVIQQFPMVNVVKGNGELYWNRGMHTAWERAISVSTNFEHFFWLNDDTNIYPNAILTLLAAADETDNKAIICGCIESPFDKGKLTYGGGTLNRSTSVLNEPSEKVIQCDVIHGNCVLVPNYVFDKVGNLDWKFTHAIGDHDYSLRARRLGIRSFITGEFVASCEKNESLPKWLSSKLSLTTRIKNLYSPLSYSPPNEFFIYERRHFGLGVALKHFFTIHLRVLVPGIKKYLSH
jgi:GT2 family glycosyltransferase